MDAGTPLVILLSLFAILYPFALYQIGKEHAELPEKIDKILRELYLPVKGE